MEKIKVFLPVKRESSHYFDEIIQFTKHEFIFDNYRNYKKEYQCVNIHWPESIFDWVEPTLLEIDEFKTLLLEWKKYSKIIYTVHNLKPHLRQTDNYEKLYKIIESNADVFIHLGIYSKEFFEKKYNKAEHKIVKHPLFKISNEVLDKKTSRKLLGIDNNALVIIAPGRIRNLNEKKMVIDAFKSIRRKNKVLISTNMLKQEELFYFPWRYRFKRLIDIKAIFNKYFKAKYVEPKYIFNYHFTDAKTFSLMLSASDIVLIPRIEILNSGVLFLGLTYKKIIVGPNQGNITEHLKMFNFPIFNPMFLKSVNTALAEAIKLFEKSTYKFDAHTLDRFLPKEVALVYDNIFKEILKK